MDPSQSHQPSPDSAAASEFPAGAMLGIGDLGAGTAAPGGSGDFARAVNPARRLPLSGKSRARAVPKRGRLRLEQHLAENLQNRWRSYRQQLRRCRSECSEDSVHELRVAMRRLLSSFTLLGCIVPGTPVEKARRNLKDRLDALSELRDTHVQRLFIDQHLADFPELILMRRFLQRRERRLIRQAGRKICQSKNRKLGKWLTAIAQGLARTTTRSGFEARHLSTLVRAASEAFATVLERRKEIVASQPQTIHKTRVAFKKFRYMAEALSPAVTGFGPRQLRTLAAYQRMMGRIQDLEVMQALLAGFVEKHEGAEVLLRPFARHLRRRGAHALSAFLKSADRVFGFWPPPSLRTGSAAEARKVLRFRVSPNGSVRFVGAATPEALPGRRAASRIRPRPERGL